MKNIFEREGQSIEKLDSLFVWTVLATLLGARSRFLYDWEYFRNHLIEILLPVRERWEFIWLYHWLGIRH
jgi:prolipoprotein diacylglyceryltransferase